MLCASRVSEPFAGLTMLLMTVLRLATKPVVAVCRKFCTAAGFCCNAACSALLSTLSVPSSCRHCSKCQCR